jgi:hypothetical protein
MFLIKNSIANSIKYKSYYKPKHNKLKSFIFNFEENKVQILHEVLNLVNKNKNYKNKDLKSLLVVLRRCRIEQSLEEQELELIEELLQKLKKRNNRV